MKKILIATFVVVFGFSTLFHTAHAIFMPFGGKVTSPYTAGVVCPGTGPATITPDSFSPATPYYVAPGVLSGYGALPPSAYVLGLYNPILTPLCETTSTPPVPYLVFPIIIYGTSTPTL